MSESILNNAFRINTIPSEVDPVKLPNHFLAHYDCFAFFSLNGTTTQSNINGNTNHPGYVGITFGEEHTEFLKTVEELTTVRNLRGNTYRGWGGATIEVLSHRCWSSDSSKDISPDGYWDLRFLTKLCATDILKYSDGAITYIADKTKVSGAEYDKFDFDDAVYPFEVYTNGNSFYSSYFKWEIEFSYWVWAAVECIS